MTFLSINIDQMNLYSDRNKEIMLTTSPRFESTYKSDEKFFKSGNENIFYDTKRGKSLNDKL